MKKIKKIMNATIHALKTPSFIVPLFLAILIPTGIEHLFFSGFELKHPVLHWIYFGTSEFLLMILFLIIKNWFKKSDSQEK